MHNFVVYNFWYPTQDSLPYSKVRNKRATEQGGGGDASICTWCCMQARIVKLKPRVDLQYQNGMLICDSSTLYNRSMQGSAIHCNVTILSPGTARSLHMCHNEQQIANMNCLN